MHVWTLDTWMKYYENGKYKTRSGLRLRIDKEVDLEVKRACKEFCKWLRTEYYFPIRVSIYLKSANLIKALDGDMVVSTFFEPASRCDEPYIRLATGDYLEMLSNNCKDNALAAIIGSIAHELTHYFQWINDVKLTEIGYERQARAYVQFILDEYAETREHP